MPNILRKSLIEYQNRNDSRRQLERRRFLRTLGGTALSVPFLHDLFGSTAASAAGAAPKRVIIWVTAMGTIMEHWEQPVGKLGTLKPLLAPLQPHVSDITQLYIEEGGIFNGGGHPGYSRTLTGLKDAGTQGAGAGASIDQYLGKMIGGATRFPVLEFGAGLNYSGDPENFNRLLWAEGNKPLAAEDSPAAMFARLYGEEPGAVQPGASMRDPALDKSMFDAIAADITALQTRLVGEERAKLQLHLESIRNVERQVSQLNAQVCTGGSEPLAVRQEEETYYQMTPAIVEAHTDLMVNALACDMTRVISFQMGQEGNGSMRFPFLGHEGTLHSYSHEDRFFPPGEPMYNCLLWYGEQFASLLSKLKSVPDGDGTLLDSTWVAWITTMHDGRLHNNGLLPLVTAGSGGGTMKTGEYIHVKNRYLTDMCTTIANVMDVPIDGYGDPELSNGNISELFV
jgi:hypothetical protein